MDGLLIVVDSRLLSQRYVDDLKCLENLSFERCDFGTAKDCAEGLTDGFCQVFKAAVAQGLQPVLFLNKLDKLLSLEPDNELCYQRLAVIVEALPFMNSVSSLHVCCLPRMLFIQFNARFYFPTCQTMHLKTCYQSLAIQWINDTSLELLKSAALKKLSISEFSKSVL